MKKVLLTGAHGFLGRHAARAFAEQKWHVQGVGHGNWPEAEWKAWGLSEWHETDINLNALMTYGGEPDVIIHCAGSANVAFSMKFPAQDFERSVSTTVAVLEYARLQSPVIAVVFPSSAAVYGKVRSLPITEDQALQPVSPYGVHKLLCEQVLGSYARHFGVPVGVVRYFSLYGEGLRKQILWDACNRLSRGENVFFGSGRETRDFLHVHDAAQLLYTAATNADTQCPVINGGSGVQTTIADILVAIEKNLPGAAAPVFSGDIRVGDPVHYQADVTKARSWGWKPRYNLPDGISEYVRWFRKYSA
jgi:UDP-glucose 4-epimerase